VELTDPQGRNPKDRPAVIVTATEEIQPDGEVWVVAISTQMDAAPAEEQVALPWHPQRHPRTGLTERSSAVCTWLRKVPLSSIRKYGGMVPGRQLIELMGKVDALLPPTP
jgi:hypothetical protein